MNSSPSLSIARQPTCGRLALIDRTLSRFPAALTLLLLRLALAIPFFRSGLTKWDGWFDLSDGTKYLFAEEFRLHILGGVYAYPAPHLAAVMAGVAEIVLPLLLVLGLATRFAGLGLLLMTAVIQLTVPEGWANFHLPWAAMSLAVVTYGAGAFSADHALGRRVR